MHKITTVINFCSNEAHFIDAAIEQARLFSSRICIPVADHFFNGEKENIDLLEKLYAQYPDCIFIQFPFSLNLLPKKWIQEVGHPRVWHNIARWLGITYADASSEYILFLDADEIIDAKPFIAWLTTKEYQNYHVMKLSNYWYFRDYCYRATTFEDSILLAKKSLLSRDMVLHKEERDAIYNKMLGPKKRNILSLNQSPMAHHYSWVRSKEEMLRKTESWGHSHDRNWKKCIEQEFAQEFNGTDFVHGYSFEKVEPFIAPKKTFAEKKSNPQVLLTEDQFKKILGISNNFLMQFLQRKGICS